MTDIILAREGTVDKYIGDAIVAFWNAPLDVTDHTRRAVEASLAMRTALVEFNRKQADLLGTNPHAVQNVRNGVGLNVGPCSVGNMGSLQRFDYSALGDPVNVAARLEALTKSYGVDVLASQLVRDGTSTYAWLEVDEVQVKGRSAATKLFTVVGDETFATSSDFRAWADEHNAMLSARRAGRAEAARRAAMQLASSCPPHWTPLYESLARKYGEAIEREEAEGEATTAVLKPEWSV
jgi:adenylate cyclase